MTSFSCIVDILENTAFTLYDRTDCFRVNKI